MTNAVIPYVPSPVANEFPPHMLEVLQVFQNEDNYDLRRILSLDAAYMQQTPISHDEHLSDIRFEQAAYIQKLIKQANDVINGNRFYLAWLLIEASKRALFTYIGYETLRQWCDSLHIERSLLRSSLQLAERWPWLQQFGYSINEVVDGSFTEEKMRHLLHIAKDQGRVRARAEIAAYQEYQERLQSLPITQEHVEEDEEQEPSKSLVKAIRRTVSELPEEEQKMYQAEVEHHYVHAMREQIDRVRAEDPDTYFAEQNSLKGLTTRPYILLHCRRQGNTMLYTAGTFQCGEGEIRAFIAGGQVEQRYEIDGHVFTEAQFGAYLDETFVPDREQRYAPTYETTLSGEEEKD